MTQITPNKKITLNFSIFVVFKSVSLFKQKLIHVYGKVPAHYVILVLLVHARDTLLRMRMSMQSDDVDDSEPCSCSDPESQTISTNVA